jgi:hypothetical protein
VLHAFPRLALAPPQQQAFWIVVNLDKYVFEGSIARRLFHDSAAHCPKDHALSHHYGFMPPATFVAGQSALAPAVLIMNWSARETQGEQNQDWLHGSYLPLILFFRDNSIYVAPSNPPVIFSAFLSPPLERLHGRERWDSRIAVALACKSQVFGRLLDERIRRIYHLSHLRFFCALEIRRH